MLRDDQSRSHRTTYEYMRHVLTTALREAESDNNGMKLSGIKLAIVNLDDAWNLYALVNAEWRANNTDATMINLIGHWSRMTKIIRELDDEYGSKE